MLLVLLTVVAVLVLYNVTRVAVHHGIRDADRSRTRDASRSDDRALRASSRRSRGHLPE